MEPFRHPAPLRTELSVDTTRRPLARTHGNSAGVSTKRLLRELHAAPSLGEAARVAARRGEYELCVQPTAAALNVTKDGPATADFTRHGRGGDMDYPYDLGCYSRKVTTASAEAQRWFDRGLNWCFGYHHEEAVACFEKALAADPNCAIPGS